MSPRELVPSRLRVDDLRHTAAALMIASGANVKMVQRQLGHKSATQTLDTYGHLFPTDLDDLSAAMDAMRPAPGAHRMRTDDATGEVVAIREAV